VLLLAASAGLATTQVVFRYLLNASLPWPEEVARWALNWMVFLGMPVLVAQGSHVAIDLLGRRMGQSGRARHEFFVRAMVAAASVMMITQGVAMVGHSTYVSPAMGWPYLYLYAALPVGAALNLVYLAQQRYALRLPAAGVLACVAGAAVYTAYRWIALRWLGGADTAGLLMGAALAFILAGVPIAFSLAFGAFAAFAPRGDLLLVTVAHNMTSSIDSFTLLAIPFFILAAAVMNTAGITERLIDFAAHLVGHLRGGLGYVNVLTNTVMAGVSGSSMADAAAIGKVLIPEMERHGYGRAFACALTSASAVLANLIPPSLGLLVFGALASVSVGALFVATIVPGLLLAAVLATSVYVLSLRRGYGRTRRRSTARERLAALRTGGPALVLPVLIVGGIRLGVFTATEAGAIAVGYALLCGALIYRAMHRATLAAALRGAVHDTVAVMVIVSAAAPFAWVLAAEQIPQRIAQALGSLAASPQALLLLVNVFLLGVGLFMEMIAAMVILVPILAPMVKAAGVDLVHFGVVLVMNIVIGALTPPMGMLVFTTSRVGNAAVADVFREVMPFLLGMIATLLVVSYFPSLSLALVGAVGR
jgi:C4-dicarboxylate transporter DctM subunit